jgi:hypothetical protein
MRKLIFAITITLVAVVSTAAQDKAPGKFEISAALTESSDTPSINLQGPKGLSVEADGRIGQYGILRVGGFAQFNRANIDKDGVDPVDRYTFGPSFTFALFKNHLAPYAAAGFGFRTSYNQLASGVSDRVFSRRYGAGLKVYPGGDDSGIFVRAGFDIIRESDVVNTDLGTANQKRFSFGGGFRF